MRDRKCADLYNICSVDMSINEATATLKLESTVISSHENQNMRDLLAYSMMEILTTNITD